MSMPPWSWNRDPLLTKTFEPKRMFFTEVCGERWEEREGLGDLATGQLTHEGPHLSRGVVAPV